jgi:hypothetical protein
MAMEQPKPDQLARRLYGPRPLGSLLPRLTRPAFRATNPATAQVMGDWAAIVGPLLASVSAPRRLATGTLTIACAGPVAIELQHYASELIERINIHLGSPTVRALRFVQTALPAPRPAVPPAPVSAVVIATAESAVAALPEGELREALAALGRAVLAGDPPRGKTSTA